MKKHNISLYSILFVPLLLLFTFNSDDSKGLDSSISENYEEAPSDCYFGQLSFKGGEELVYKLYYNWNFIWIPGRRGCI